MRRHPAIIRASATHLAEAASTAIRAYRENRVEHEPEITDRMLGAIEQAMTGFEVKGVRWTAKTLTSRSGKSQETRYGADFVGALDIDLPDFKVKKGFLAQAKRIEPDKPMRSDEFSRMQDQCSKMLEVSGQSFVFLYSKSGISIVPAGAVVSASHCNPHELYSRGIARFYEEHFESFIGDRQISAASVDVLEKLRDRMRAQRVLYLAAQQ